MNVLSRYRTVLIIIILFLLTSDSHSQVYSWRKKFASAAATVGINPLNPNSVYAEGSTGTFFISYDRGNTWNQRTSPGISLIRQIIVHPADTNTIFCAAGSGVGLRKSTDYGLSWKTVISGYNIDGESMTYDVAHPDTMYAGRFENGNVYRSTDRGETWTVMGTTGSVLCALAVRPDSVNIILAGSGGGTISKSTDFGTTWRVVHESNALGFQEVPKIIFSQHNPLLGYSTIYGQTAPELGVWKTTDGGENWLQTSLQFLLVWGMVMDPGNDSILYVGTFDDNSYGVYKTTNAGSSWTFESLGFPLRGFNWSLKLHPLDPTILWAALTNGTFGFGGIYRWTSSTAAIEGYVRDAITNEPVTLGYIRIPSTGDSVSLAQEGGKFRFGYFEGDPSTTPSVHIAGFPYYPKDDQLNFTPGSTVNQDIFVTKLPVSSIQGVVVDSMTGTPVRTQVRLYSTTSFGPAVASESTDASGKFHFDNISISYQGIINYSKLEVSAAEIPYAVVTISPVMLDSAGLNFTIDPRADVFLVGEDSANYTSYYTTALQSAGIKTYPWNIVTKGSAPLSRVNEFKKHTLIYFTGTKHTPLALSEADSLTTLLDAGGNLFLTGQDIAELNDTTSLLKNYLGIGYGGAPPIYYMKGLSSTELFGTQALWISVGGGANNQTSADILSIKKPSTKHVLGYGSTGLSGTSAVRVDSAGNGKAVVFGFGFEGIYQTTIQKTFMQKILAYFDGSIIPTDVNDGELSPAVPEAFRLDQNYPNPFNPTTIIDFQLPNANYVNLKIYNVLGEEIATLVNEVRQPGSYEVRWDASGVPSGVYYYRLTISTSSEVKKMVLIR